MFTGDQAGEQCQGADAAHNSDRTGDPVAYRPGGEKDAEAETGCSADETPRAVRLRVTYDSPAGKREVRARMRTSPDRVPTDGSKVVVYTDLEGAIHIELDAFADTIFGPEQRYTAAE